MKRAVPSPPKFVVALLASRAASLLVSESILNDVTTSSSFPNGELEPLRDALGDALDRFQAPP